MSPCPNLCLGLTFLTATPACGSSRLCGLIPYRKGQLPIVAMNFNFRQFQLSESFCTLNPDLAVSC